MSAPEGNANWWDKYGDHKTCKDKRLAWEF